MDTRARTVRHGLLIVATLMLADPSAVFAQPPPDARAIPEPETPAPEVPDTVETTAETTPDATVIEPPIEAQHEVPDTAAIGALTSPPESEPFVAPPEVAQPVASAPVQAPAPPVPATGDVRVHFEPGQGLQITSNDGRFELILRARAQFVATLRHVDGQDAGIDFELRRARIYFQGALFDPNIRFTLQLGVSPSCSDMGNNFAGNSCVGPQPTAPTTLSGFTPRWSPLLDWYVELRHLRELNVRVGQMIPTFSRTFTTSDANYQFIDRSLEDGEFNLDRTFAVELRSTDFTGLGWLRYYAGIMSTQGRDMPFAPDLHLGYYARIDVNPLGFFNDYAGADLARNVDPKLSIGAAYAFLDHAPFDRGTIGVLPLDGGTTDQHVATADFVFMWQGFSLIGEWAMRQATRHQGTTNDPMTMMPYASPTLGRTGFGMQAITGVMLGDLPLEIVGRASMLRHMNALDGSAHSAILDQNELGGGINWYIQGHPLKLMLWFTDVWRDDGTGSSGTQLVRLQFQAAL